ncbi:nitroreductase family protein [Flavivirga aquimarina]|uniref:Nitroreductase family protein n=1 Tax=Flavivirga aquimarina TaxID=2027862 RepID=A0ABT8W8N4_9FLAO|nr:nitroreductase family protein [Flavivirga aquimarina]MDO5969493.1 nitroreductase family protein [Flavivirga aquimarina]
MLEIKQKIRNILIKIGLISPRLSTLYYFLFSNRFDNVHYAILSGIHENRLNTNNIGNFRRSIHRIEKGLITTPSKPFFAEGYIKETIESYGAMIINPNDENLILWASNVLQDYFDKVEHTNIIKSAFNHFNLLGKYEINEKAKPYKAQNKICSISYDDYLDLNKYRRSIRYYTNKVVPRELIEKAVKAALYAPSACNRQPFSFFIIEGNKNIHGCDYTPDGAQSFSKNIHTMIYVIGDYSYYFHERDKNVIFVDGGLVVMNLVLALETLGVSSCICNWGDLKDKNNNLSKKLSLKPYQSCITTLSIGYALENSGIASSIKKTVDSVVKYHSELPIK